MKLTIYIPSTVDSSSHRQTSRGHILLRFFNVLLYLFVAVGVVVFTLNSSSFYPTTSAVPSVSFLILHPRDTINTRGTNSVVSEAEKNQGSEKIKILSKQIKR